MPRQSKAKTPSPRWRRRKDDRPEEIVVAALEEFATRGFAAARLDDIAKRAGVSKGTLYLYFADKEQLFRAVVEQTLMPNIKAGEAFLADASGDTATLIKSVLAGLSTQVAGSRIGAIPKLVIAEAGNFPEIAKFYYEHVITRGMRLIGGLVERGKARGEFRAEIDPALAAPVLLGPFLLLAIFKETFERHAPGRIDLQAFLKTYADIVFGGLARPKAKGE